MGEQVRAKGHLGLVVGQRRGRLVVVETSEGSPAQHAGIARGDFLVRIDDETTDGLSRKAAAERLRGFTDEPLTLWIERPGVSGLLRFDLVRAEKSAAWTQSLPKLLMPVVAPLLAIGAIVYVARSGTSSHREAVERYGALLRDQRLDEAYALVSDEAGRSFEAWKGTLHGARLDRVGSLTITATEARGSGRGCVSAIVTTGGERVGLTFFTQETSSETRIREALTNEQASGWSQKGPWQCK